MYMFTYGLIAEIISTKMGPDLGYELINKEP